MEPYKPADRKFTLLDAVILLAATAIGLAGVREYFDTLFTQSFRFPSGGWTPGAILGHIPRVLEILFPLLVAWTPAVLVLRLRRPRPVLRRLFLQPGASACGAVTLAFALGISQILGDFSYHIIVYGFQSAVRSSPFLLDKNRFWIELYEPIFGYHPSLAASVIIAVWALLAISRLCRPEPHWVDRAGRAIGVIWLAVYVCGGLDDHLPYLVPSWFPDNGEGGR